MGHEDDPVVTLVRIEPNPTAFQDRPGDFVAAARKLAALAPRGVWNNKLAWQEEASVGSRLVGQWVGG